MWHQEERKREKEGIANVTSDITSKKRNETSSNAAPQVARHSGVKADKMPMQLLCRDVQWCVGWPAAGTPGVHESAGIQRVIAILVALLSKKMAQNSKQG